MLFLTLILVQIGIFGILVLFLRQIISRNITHATDHLSEINSDYNQKLEDAKKRQQEADHYYDETLVKAKTDTEKLKAQILKEAREVEENLVKQGRKQVEDILQQANNAKDTIVSEAERHIEQGAILKACDLIEQVLPQAITLEMHEQWCADLLRHGLDTLKRLNMSGDVKEAQIISAHPLEAAQKAAFEKKIREETGKPLKLTETVDPSLIAGICVKIGSVVIDGSLKFRINEAVRHAKSAVQG